MTRRAACPPPPFPGHSATLHLHTLTPDETLYRVYRGADPAHFRITTGNNRFDPLPSPWSATKALYGGSSKEVAISETVLRWHDRVGDSGKIILSRSQVAGRQLVGCRWDHPVRLLDFTGFGMKPLAELVSDGRADDIFLCDASNYGSTQQWAAWFRSNNPDAAGFRWMSRHHNSSYCYVFFDDVCQGFKLTITEAAEPLEAGTQAFQLLQDYLSCLSWEIES